jgi:hypothetical protein
VKNQRKNQKTISKERSIKKKKNQTHWSKTHKEKKLKKKSPEPMVGQTQADQTQTGRASVVWVTHCLDRHRLAHYLDHRRPPHPHHPARRHPTLLPASSSFFVSSSFFLLFFSSFLSSYNQVFPYIIRWGWFYFDSVFHVEVTNYE